MIMALIVGITGVFGAISFKRVGDRIQDMLQNLVATIGENRKILVFPLDELPEMPRGKGVKLQSFKDGGLAPAEMGRVVAAMRAAGKATSDSADLSLAAFSAIAQNAMASMATEAAGRALFETAAGFASWAWYDWNAAKNHFTSAAIYGSVAAIGGAGALAIGATRGMTAAEKASAAPTAIPGVRSGRMKSAYFRERIQSAAGVSSQVMM